MVQGDRAEAAPSEAGMRIFESLMWFIGTKTISGDEKKLAVQRLRELAQVDRSVTPAMVERVALKAGKQPKIARELKKIHEGVLSGKTFLDHSRRPI